MAGGVEYYISNRGTNTTYTTSSASWTAAQEFNFTDLQTILTTHLETGDIIWFDDDTFDFGAFLAMSIGGTISYTAKSRSADATICILNSTEVDDWLFDIYGEADVTFEDITFTKSVTHTSVNPCLFRSRTAADAILFTRCVFRDVTTSTTADSSAAASIFQANVQAAAPNTITFTDCTFKDCSFSDAKKPAFIVVGDGRNVVINDMTIDNIDMTSSNEARGMFWIEDGTLDVNGMEITNITNTGDSSSTMVNTVFYAPTGNAAAITLDDVNVDGVTILGSEGGILGVLCHNSGTAALTMKNCSITNAVNDVAGNSEGCLFCSDQFAGDSVSNVNLIEDCQAYNNRGFYGAGGYNTFSGSMTLRRVKCYNNDGGASGIGLAGGDIYGVDFHSGGSGSLIMDACEAYGATVNSGATASSVNLLHNIASGRYDESKIISISNCTFANPATTSVPILNIEMNLVGYDFTVNIKNTIIRGGTGDIRIANTAGNGNLNTTLTNCNYTTLDETSLAVGTTTETASVDRDPVFMGTTDQRLAAGSSDRAAGAIYVIGSDKATGSATTDTADRLVDAGATFLSSGVKKGDIVQNTSITHANTVTVIAVVVTTTSETSLLLSEDIFPAGTEDYTIYSPVVNSDVRGRRFSNPPPIGCYAPSSGDPATTRTARS